MVERVRVYRELDEVSAPEDVPAAGVKRGDQGVVLVEFEYPHSAVEVEYVGADGEPGPCVIYSPDLRRNYSHHPGYNGE